MLKLGFLASHTGSNMQAIINACAAGTLAAEPCVAISNNSQSGALTRARQANMATYHLSTQTHGEGLGAAILATLRRHGVEVVCLAGYMKKLGAEVLAAAQMPAVDQPVMGQIGYHIRNGGHDLAEYDWEQYLDFADRHLGR